MRRRARLIAVAVVLGTATIAYGDFTVTVDPSSAGTGSMGTTMRTVFSARNTAATSVTASIGAFAPFVACSGMTLTEIGGTAAPQYTWAPNEQRQFVITASYSSAGMRTCPWTIDGGPGHMGSFTSAFTVDTATNIINAQPSAFLFAVTGASETQRALLQNYTTTLQFYTNVTINDGGLDTVRFVGGLCDGMQVCPGGMISAGSFHTFDIRCTPPLTGQVSGTITYTGMAGTAQQTFICRRAGMPPVIDIVPAAVTLTGPPGTPAPMAVSIAGPGDSIQSATIVGADPTAFRLTMPAPACGGAQSCTFSPPQAISASTTLTVECTPGMSQKTAKLRVQGTAHAGDTDEADLTCVADGGLSATPALLPFGDVKVTTTSAPQTITIENLGSTAASVQVDTGHPDWLVDTCGAAPCTIAGGDTQDVAVRFRPSAPGDNDRTLTISLGGMPAASVELTGSGVGSRMRITNQAAPYAIDFGTIGLDTNRVREVRLQADGNRSLNVVIGAPAAPFATSMPALDLAAGAEGMFEISCQSPAPGTYDGMVTLTPGPPDHVYAADAPKVDVRCRVANTPVQLTPDELDFGEVRRNEPAPTIDVAIHNPSASPISLDHVRLANAGPLTISMPADETLDPGETITATITLSTATEVTVEAFLEVGVGGEELVTPITGKVVTASARVTPTSLRLGSVCVGTMIDEPVKLVNDGTARLRVQPPTMDEPFAVSFVNPTSYPATGALLDPLQEATASVRIATTMKARVASKLAWDVDVTGAPFVIDATLDIKDAGIAVSPQAIGFDQVRVEERSDRRTIRLENCGDGESEIVLAGVEAVRGSAGAWELAPEALTTRLQPRQKLAIEVRFAPTRPGPHVAIVKLAVDGVAEEIELTGDGIGENDDRASFYACSCNAPGAPWQGLPVLVIVVLVIGRRRSGSSSAR